MKKKFLFFGLSFIFAVCACLISFLTIKSNVVYAVYTYSQENDLSEFLKFEQAVMELNKESDEEKDLGTNVACSFSSYNETNHVDEVGSEFALKRLIVQGNVVNTYGATNKISYNNLHILCYSSELATEQAYQQLLKNDSLDVIIDKVEKAQGYADQDYSYDSYTNWGAESADIGGYREFLVDNNVEKEVVVVVLDTGINTSHPMFTDRLLYDEKGKVKGFSYFDSEYRYSYDNLAFDEDDPNTFDIDEGDSNKYSFEDDHVHGSHVAGIICDLTPKNVKILPIKIGDSNGYSSTDVFIAAYLRVINIYSKQYNIACTNLSFSGAGKDSESDKNTFNEQCYEPLMNLNILPITAAGNENFENNIEGLKAVVVSALKKENNQYKFDNSYSNYGKIIDISAPGTNIYSAIISEIDSGCANLDYKDGTSMASPQVAGVVALLSLNPNLPSNFTASDMEQMLYDNSLDMGDWGYDDYYGHGILNLKYFETDKTEETLSFYRDSNLVSEYEEYENFEQDFELSIQCSNPNYDIIYTIDKTIPTISNSNNYSSKFNVLDSIYIYAMGIKIEDGEVVERTSLYNISYFDSLTPVDDCFEVDSMGFLINYTGNYTNLTIPNIVDGKIVKTLSYGLFRYSNIESITLSESIEDIAGYCFESCKKLKYIYAPNVSKIYVSAFSNCSAIPFISDNNPEGAEEGAFFSNLKETVGATFNQCSILEWVELSKLATLGDIGYDFQACTNLKSVNLPAITSIPEGTFKFCENLTGTFQIGEHVTSIESGAFGGTKINKFIVDKNNTNFVTDGYGVYSTNSLVAFACGNENINYEILTSTTKNNIEFTIKTISQHVMATVKINKLTIPYSITVIEGGAFVDSEINYLYYNATNCSHSGYYDEIEYYLEKPFCKIKTIEIGANVEVVPQRLFQRANFNNLIINSYNTQLSESCFYITDREWVLNNITFKFSEEIDDVYLEMFGETGIAAYSNKLNYLYAKTEIPERLTDGYYFRLRYSIHDGEFYVYSNESLEDKFILKASTNQYGQISQDSVLYVSEGTSQTYMFTPNLGYHVSNILVDSVNLTGNELTNAIENGYTFSDITDNHTIEALFEANTYSINYKDEDGNNIQGLTPISYQYGVGAVLPTLTKEGYVFEWWFDNANFEGDVVTAISSIDFGDKVYYAKFNKIYKITIVQSENGTISSGGTTQIVQGANVTISFTPNIGYHVESIIIDGTVLTGTDLTNAINNGYIFTNVSANHRISATYAINKYIITTTTDGNGTISPSGNSEVIYGENKTFTFVPNTGYQISEVYVDGVNLGSISTYTFEDVVKDHEIYVTFNRLRYSITATIGANGRINRSTVSNIFYGESLNYIFTPNIGYKIKDVKIDGTSIGAQNSYIFTNVTSNHTISVEFEIKKYNITLSVDGEGEVYNDRALENIPYGESRIFTILAEKGWTIHKVYINGESVEVEGDELRISNIDEDLNIQVIFKEKAALFALNSTTIAILVGSAIISTLLITLIIKSNKNMKKRKLEGLTQEVLVPEDEYNNHQNEIISTQHSKQNTISPPKDSKQTQQNVMLKKAITFVKGKEQAFIKYCTRHNIDYRNNYNIAVLMYYQAYLRSLKK